MGIRLYEEPRLEKPDMVASWPGIGNYPNIANPRPDMVASWPGIGNVGVIAADTLRGQIRAEELGEIEPWDFFYPSRVIIREGMVRIYDKENRTEGMVHIDSGLSALRKGALELIPENCPFDLADLYRELARRREMLAYEVKQRFYQIGSFEGLKEFENLITGGLYDSNQNTCQDSPGGWGN